MYVEAAIIIASAAMQMYSNAKQSEAEREALDREIEYNGLLLAEEERKTIENRKLVERNRNRMFAQVTGINAARNVDINGVGSAQDYWEIADKAQQDLDELTHQIEVQRRLYEKTGQIKQAAKEWTYTASNLKNAQTLLDTGYRAYSLNKGPSQQQPSGYVKSGMDNPAIYQNWE